MALIISDRALKSRQVALFGDGSTPGAYALMELVLPVVTGQLFNAPKGVISEPAQQEILIVKSKDEKRNLPGRAAIVLTLHCRGGHLQARLDSSPTL